MILIGSFSCPCVTQIKREVQTKQDGCLFLSSLFAKICTVFIALTLATTIKSYMVMKIKGLDFFLMMKSWLETGEILIV